MLSRETLEMYKRMSTEERLRLTLEAMRDSMPWLLYGSPEFVDRKFELIRRENDENNRALLEGLARAEERMRERTR